MPMLTWFYYYIKPLARAAHEEGTTIDSASAMVLSKTYSHTDGDHVPTALPTSEVALQIVINDDQKQSLLFRLPRIIARWEVMILPLGLLTLGFPCTVVQEFNKALITYMAMLILELGIWIPMCTYISPPDEGQLKKTKRVLRASSVIFNHVSNISEQIISSISNSNYGISLIFFNLVCGAVSFLIISALLWLTIDVEETDWVNWEHLPLACNAVLSATVMNISVFQLIVKNTFLRFPLLAILRTVIDLIDYIIKVVRKKKIA